MRTLRQKVGLLAQGGEPMEWGAELCRQWMAAAPEQAGVLYVDGQSGKEAALLPLPPLRTGRESFPSSGSSL